MSEMMPTSVDLNQLIQAHKANYEVFRARTEKEIREAIYKALQASPYVSLYYAVSKNGLTGVVP